MEKSGENGGFFVISFDFELHWGMFDKVSDEDNWERYQNVRNIVPELLHFFSEHDIHATWATVGMLMHEHKESLLRGLPKEALRPRYKDMRLSAYTHLATAHVGTSEKSDPSHFAPSLVHEILQTPHQELASHTFSHYYCVDGGENSKAVFAADCEALENIFASFDTKPTSIVFPRNQATSEALEVCAERGMTAYRGTEDHFLYKPRKDDAQSLPIRALRLIDAYFNITGHHTVPVTSIYRSNGKMANVPASRFLRPYNKRLRFLEKRRMRRIKDSMTHAAKHGEVFHLWWHPHNFGADRKENMRNLTELINHFEILKETYGMQSKNMREVAAYAKQN